MSDHLKGLLITALGVMMIVPDSLFVRLIGADAYTIAFWRALFAGLTIGCGVLIFQGPGAFRGLTRHGRPMLIYILTLAVSSNLFVVAVSMTSVANVVFIIAAMPAFAALFSFVFLGERLSRRTALTIAAVAVGIAIIAFGSGDSERATIEGDLVALLVPAFFAIALTAARSMKSISLLPAIPVSFLIGTIVLAPFATPMSVPSDDWIFVILHGGVFIAASTAFISMGPRYLPSAEVSLLILLESVLAPILAWVVVDEDPGRWAIVGGSVVIGALAVSNLVALARRRRHPGAISDRLEAHVVVEGDEGPPP
ncbi:DMT family transporter [Maritimibacter fusiformis]|uniref:DMT family transporter n=1 Tax=Maritimibacter fusiformis TaxID=2603819 RepID=A0A5D0RMS7_9RHOB|nr:DMT family transporter [Maritimibacter fusiformis]TYB82246.1 DMT family transporter [Maritimibacter fusiformis]